MTIRLLIVFYVLTLNIFAQSNLDKGIEYYNQRHENCIEDRADPVYITKAISFFENCLNDQKTKEEASLYLLKSYYFKAKFTESDKEKKKEILKKGKGLGQDLIEKNPESVDYIYWYLVNLGSWAEVYGVLSAAREGVADKMRTYSKKIIEMDPNYEDGAGYFMLGAVHYKSPYIPFLLSWPSNSDAIKWLELAYNTGESKIAQAVYLAMAYKKDGQKNKAIEFLDKVMSLSPSSEYFASDWEWIKKAKILSLEYK
tara:strand:- start:1712 stop:2479 length:768 start_codon:yes stop_codon:yes gene_type:complete